MINKINSFLNKPVFKQLIKYFFVGAIAAIIDIGSFAIFTKLFNIDYRLAVFFSFTLGTLTNFLICNAFVFDRKELSIFNACIRHYFSSIGGLIVNEIVMISLIEIINFNYLITAKIIATICAFLVNFILIKFFAFNSKIKIIQRTNHNEINNK